MNENFKINFYLDTRRKKKNGKYPVRLMVYSKLEKQKKIYSTAFDLTPAEFERIWLNGNPRGENRKYRKQLEAIETNAMEAADKCRGQTFEEFERFLHVSTGDTINIAYHYSEKIKELKKFNQLNTSTTYINSRNSLQQFAKEKKQRDFNKLTFYDITPEWLKEYEFYFTRVKGGSIATVGIYLRSLRTLFNIAIDKNFIERDFYPFGKRKYQIPTSGKVKKTLKQDQLRVLFHAEPQNQEQAKARDFWFFSYACNGMNPKDIALLKYKNYDGDSLSFERAKTKGNRKAGMKYIVIYLNDFSAGIIKKYGTKNTNPDNYIFNIIDDQMTPEDQRKGINNFVRFINQHIKNLAKANGLPEQITTYWARHTFATNSIRNGATMEFIQESLGHGDLKTTQNYFAGFDDDAKKEFSRKLMDF
ncbi:MAG: tyrosine-type recombinase/integrase [Bacteroidota bacterium]